MTTIQTATTTCDFCGYGGPWTEPQDFKNFGTIDLCVWCADSGEHTWIECGQHRVEFTPDGASWRCSCGERYFRPLFLSAALVAAVPSLVVATANHHISH